MDPLYIAITLVSGLLAVGCFVMCWLAHKQRGPILTLTYLFANPKEREKLYKPFEYKEARNLFLLLGILFVLIAVSVFYPATWMNIAIAAVIILAIIYLIVQSAQRQKAREDEHRND